MSVDHIVWGKNGWLGVAYDLALAVHVPPLRLFRLGKIIVDVFDINERPGEVVASPD